MENLINYFNIILEFLVLFAEKAGYLGIFVFMFLESTFVPVPSELVMIPVGISAASAAGLNLYWSIIVGTLGNLCGAIFSYYLAISLGRAVVLKIGKYFFISPETIIKVENYFKKHGNISIFIGRLIPGVRHFISLPAGLAKMNLFSFSFYTATGSLIWVSILTYLGFLIGNNKELIEQYLHIIIIVCLLFSAALAVIYIFYKKVNSK